MSTRKRKFDEISSDESDKEVAVEEQVLSHAAQRRLRKRLKGVVVSEKATMENESPATTITTGAKNSNPSVHSIWVGNLSFKATPETLKAFLGNTEDIRRIHMPTKALHANLKGPRGENRGFVFSILFLGNRFNGP